MKNCNEKVVLTPLYRFAGMSRTYIAQITPCHCFIKDNVDIMLDYFVVGGIVYEET